MIALNSIFLIASFTFKIVTLALLLYGIMRTLDHFVGYSKSTDL